MKRTIPIICAICMLLTGCTGLKLDNITSLLDRETPAPSDSSQASPQTSPQPVSRSLKLDENPELYTYADMENDLKILADTYQDVAHLQDLGVQTLDGRKLYDMVIGDPNAPRHVIVHASIHAREYITTKLVMRQMMDYLQNMKAGGTYNGMSYSEMSKSTALHIIPMVNPDGVTLSQMGLSGMQTQAASDRVKEVVGLDGKTPESTDFSQWKANANGVDLNRNYDAMWQEFEGSSHPSSDRYKGESPGSEPETKALIELTKKNPVVRTISYHTYGQVVYWYFGQTGALRDETKAFADLASAVTGYMLDPDYESLDPAGYKDWAISKMNIPSLTIEVGYGSNPVPNSQFDEIYSQNRDILPAVMYSLTGTSSNVPAVHRQSKPETAPSYEEASGVMHVVNCDEWISLRESPSTGAERITTIPLGAAVEYISTSSNGFYKIRYNGQTGYALSQYLADGEASSVQAAPSTATMRVVNCDEWISLRESPSTGAERITTIPLGATVEYISTSSNGFYKIRYNGQTGYALSQYLE